MDASKVEDSVDIIDQRDQVSQPSELLKPERTQKIGKCNLRKSLAWDSAFFSSAGILLFVVETFSSMYFFLQYSITSLVLCLSKHMVKSISSKYSGVLEPEELSSMIEGVDKDGKHSLPRIEEDDLHKSTDSISTMESDSLTLESLEADLFQDIRASIQKSRMGSNVTYSKNSKAGTGETECRTNHCKYSTTYVFG